MNIGGDLLYKACYSVPDTLACKHYKLVESGIFSHVNDFRVERCIGGLNCAWACLNSEQPGGIPVGYNLIPIPVGYNLIPIPVGYNLIPIPVGYNLHSHTCWI